MLLVTGGAGFIGSNVVAALNEAGRADVAVCDVLGHDRKWRNLAKRQLADVVAPAELPSWLNGRRLEGIIHLGDISETTATGADLVIETNFRLSMRLLGSCTVNGTTFIYASHASYRRGAESLRPGGSGPLAPRAYYQERVSEYDRSVPRNVARNPDSGVPSSEACAFGGLHAGLVLGDG